MSDQVQRPVSGQGAGTPEASVSAEEQSRNAVTPGQEQTSQNETAEAKPVTAKDLETLREEIRREVQSQVDKRDTRVNKRLAEIDSAVAILRASGREITDEDVQTLKQNAAAKAMTETEQAPIAEQQADPLDVKQWPKDDPATQKVIQLRLDHGMEITREDPEAKSIELGKGDIAFVKSYEAALKAKAARLSASTQTTETKPPVPPAARIPAGSNTPASPNMTGRQYLKQASKGG